MTLSKVIANLERKIREGLYTKETEVELVIVSKHHKELILGELGKNTLEQLKGIFNK